MSLSDQADFSLVNWLELAGSTRRRAEQLPPGAKRMRELDTALACEALARSRELRLRSSGELV
jgi:ABC-type branched-subunit amino acid transport system ATPase component